MACSAMKASAIRKANSGRDEMKTKNQVAKWLKIHPSHPKRKALCGHHRP